MRVAQHTYTNATKAASLDCCVVATDDQRIFDAVKSFGGEARAGPASRRRRRATPRRPRCGARDQPPPSRTRAVPQVMLTDPKWENGTERCLEVLRALQARGQQFDIVVNIQGDEPFIEAAHIDKVVEVVAESEAVMGTLARPATGADDVTSVNNVKTVLDVNGYALYFSRALIPHNKKGVWQEGTHYWRKLGIYSYRADFLPKFIDMPARAPACQFRERTRGLSLTARVRRRVRQASLLQRAEDLEQNKVIEAGYKIKVGIVQEAVHGRARARATAAATLPRGTRRERAARCGRVDTPEQLEDLVRMVGLINKQLADARS